MGILEGEAAVRRGPEPTGSYTKDSLRLRPQIQPASTPWVSMLPPTGPPYCSDWRLNRKKEKTLVYIKWRRMDQQRNALASGAAGNARRDSYSFMPQFNLSKPTLTFSHPVLRTKILHFPLQRLCSPLMPIACNVLLLVQLGLGRGTSLSSP